MDSLNRHRAEDEVIFLSSSGNGGTEAGEVLELIPMPCLLSLCNGEPVLEPGSGVLK